MNRGSRGFMDPVFQAMRDPAWVEDSVIFLRKELSRLRELSIDLDFDAVAILIPDVHQLDSPRRSGKARAIGLDPAGLDAEGLTRAVSRALEDFAVPYVELGACLSRVPVGQLYYTRDTHFTPAGHARAAQCVRESGLLTPFLTMDRPMETTDAGAL